MGLLHTMVPMNSQWLELSHDVGRIRNCPTFASNSAHQNDGGFHSHGWFMRENPWLVMDIVMVHNG